MKNLTHNGVVYSIFIRPWKKGKSRTEVIKYPKGLRNLWERVSIDEYNAVKALNKEI